MLDAEVGIIRKLGVEFRMKTAVGRDAKLDDLRRDFDAVLVAAGEPSGELLATLSEAGVDGSAAGVEADRRSMATPVAGVFAAGASVRKTRMAVRASADGYAAAASIGQYLSGRPVTGPAREFGGHIGKLDDDELRVFLDGASGAGGLVARQGQFGLQI